MRIVNEFNTPSVHCTNVDTDFFLQFAAQGCFNRLTSFEFAARKLPVALIDLTGRTRCEKKFAIAAQQNPDGDIHHLTASAALARAVGVSHQHTHALVCWPA